MSLSMMSIVFIVRTSYLANEPWWINDADLIRPVFQQPVIGCQEIITVGENRASCMNRVCWFHSGYDVGRRYSENKVGKFNSADVIQRGAGR